MTITATLLSKYATDSASEVDSSETFDLNFANPCIDPNFVKLTATPQTNPRADAYTSDDVTFTYNPFTVEPSFCPMTVTCKTVSGPSNVLPKQNLVDGKLIWNFTPEDYTDNGLTSGDYVFLFEVSTGPDNLDLIKDFTIKVTLEDPCKNPVVTKPETSEQSYTITDLDDVYTLGPLFSVTPAFCASTISYTATGLDSYL